MNWNGFILKDNWVSEQWGPTSVEESEETEWIIMKTAQVFKVKKVLSYLTQDKWCMCDHGGWKEYQMRFQGRRQRDVWRAEGEGREGSGWNALPAFNVHEFGSMLTTENLAFDKTEVKAGQH